MALFKGPLLRVQLNANSHLGWAQQWAGTPPSTIEDIVIANRITGSVHMSEDQWCIFMDDDGGGVTVYAVQNVDFETDYTIVVYDPNA